MSCRKILIITDHLFPYCSANSTIAYEIAEYLHDKYGYDISIMGFKRFPQLSYSEETRFANVIEMEEYDDFMRSCSVINSRFLRMLKRFLTLNQLRFWIETKKEKNSLVVGYSREYRKIGLSNYDCIIAFSMPAACLEALCSNKTDAPVIAFMLDPWSTNFTITDAESEKKERCMLNRASSVFVTRELYADYKNKLKLNESLLSKLMVYDFPNIKPVKCLRSDRPECYDEGHIHCVFTGVLYADIRNPKYAIDLFRLLEDKRITLHIFGRLSGQIDCIKSLPENVIYHGDVSSEEANWYIYNADVLVNIGNTVMNMLPSKTITYISTGKPILNILKSPECPTLHYTETYPLALNVLETSEVRAEDVERVRSFVMESKGKQIPFEAICKHYYTCTPEYVGKKLYDAICEITEDNKKEK